MYVFTSFISCSGKTYFRNVEFPHRFVAIYASTSNVSYLALRPAITTASAALLSVSSSKITFLLPLLEGLSFVPVFPAHPGSNKQTARIKTIIFLYCILLLIFHNYTHMNLSHSLYDCNLLWRDPQLVIGTGVGDLHICTCQPGQGKAAQRIDHLANQIQHGSRNRQCHME